MSALAAERYLTRTERSGYELDLPSVPSVHYMTPRPTHATSNQQDEVQSGIYLRPQAPSLHTYQCVTNRTRPKEVDCPRLQTQRREETGREKWAGFNKFVLVITMVNTALLLLTAITVVLSFDWTIMIDTKIQSLLSEINAQNLSLKHH